MAEHYAFRRSGGSRGINQRCQIIGLYLVRLFIKLGIMVKRCAVDHRPHGNHVHFAHVVHYDDFFQRGLCLDGLHFAQLFQRGNKNHSRARILQEIQSLVRGQRGVNRHVNNAAVHAGKVGNHPFGAIFTQDGDPITFVNAPLFQGPGKRGDVAIKLARGDDLPFTTSLEHDVAFHIVCNRSKENVG